MSLVFNMFYSGEQKTCIVGKNKNEQKGEKLQDQSRPAWKRRLFIHNIHVLLLHNHKVRGHFTTHGENHIFQAFLQRSVVLRLSSGKGDVSALNKVNYVIP